MGREIEEPIRDLFCRGLSAVADHLKRKGPLLIFVWLALIFIKTHLKDRKFRVNRDPRADEGAIGEVYDWPGLHHVHCIARSFFTGCSVDAKAYGSMLFLSAKTSSNYEAFDYRDVHNARSVLIRFDDFAIVSVLDDGCGAWSLFQKALKKVSGPMSPIQLREVLAHLTYLNLHLRERPRFWTECGPKGALRIRGETPKRAVLDTSGEPTLGEVLFDCCEDMLSHFQNANIEEVKRLVRAGRWNFLWDARGDFDTKSMDRL
jgi:hypothetical protein